MFFTFSVLLVCLSEGEPFFMVICDGSIFLTSVVFVSANAKTRHTFFKICRVFENIPLK